MIKEYLKSDKEDDWIQYIINDLQGTCSSEFHDHLEEYRAKGFNEDNLTFQLDKCIMCCNSCGWWVESHDVDEEGYCKDCQ